MVFHSSHRILTEILEIYLRTETYSKDVDIRPGMLYMEHDSGVANELQGLLFGQSINRFLKLRCIIAQLHSNVERST